MSVFKIMYFYAPSQLELKIKIQQALKNKFTATKNTKEEKKSVREREALSKAPLFRDYVENWIRVYKAPNLKPISLKSVESTLKRPIESLGDKKIDAISTDDIQKLLLKYDGTRSRDLCKGYLSQIFKKAVLQNIISNNPCDSLELKKHKAQHKSALTRGEQEQFLIAAKETPHYLLYKFLLNTGLRIGEALALKKSDIDYEHKTVEINKNVVFVGNKKIEQSTPKSDAGNRIIPITDELLDELDKIKTEELFPCTYNAVKKSTQKISKKTGIQVSPHILRHTYSTRLEEAGISPKLRQYLMGHASIEMTENTYTDVQQDYIYSMSDKIRKAV